MNVTPPPPNQEEKDILCPARKKDMPALAMLIAMSGQDSVKDSGLNTLNGKHRRLISEWECFGCCGTMVWSFPDEEMKEELPNQCSMVGL